MANRNSRLSAFSFLHFLSFVHFRFGEKMSAVDLVAFKLKIFENKRSSQLLVHFVFLDEFSHGSFRFALDLSESFTDFSSCFPRSSTSWAVLDVVSLLESVDRSLDGITLHYTDSFRSLQIFGFVFPTQ